MLAFANRVIFSPESSIYLAQTDKRLRVIWSLANRRNGAISGGLK